MEVISCRLCVAVHLARIACRQQVARNPDRLDGTTWLVGGSDSIELITMPAMQQYLTYLRISKDGGREGKGDFGFRFSYFERRTSSEGRDGRLLISKGRMGPSRSGRTPALIIPGNVPTCLVCGPVQYRLHESDPTPHSPLPTPHSGRSLSVSALGCGGGCGPGHLLH